jgi:hypothetical protein
MAPGDRAEAVAPVGALGTAFTRGGADAVRASGGGSGAADGEGAPAADGGIGVEAAGGAEAAGGGAKGVLCTGRRGAGDGADGGVFRKGGAEAAGRVALAVGADPAGAEAGAFVAEAGGGGGMVPWPNSAGDAAGEDGSGNGAAAARYSAWARSATKP